MRGHHGQRDRRVPIRIKVRPVQRHDDRALVSDDIRDPIREQRPYVEGGLLSSRSTCLMACFVCKPRAAARPVPIA